MLCAKRKSDGRIVTAYLEEKFHGPFLCVECGAEVILKTGAQRVTHFAHANPDPCRYAEGESEAHRACKMEIFEALRQAPGVRDVALERSLGNVRPDVSAYIHEVPVAIEVQVSSLPLPTIMRRTIAYAQKGIYVLWLLQWSPELDAQCYTPTLWEKWIHAAYFGRVYYWVTGLTIASYHFDPHFQTIPKRTWRSERHKKMTAGGYSRRSKRYRMAIRGDTLNLATDFAPSQRYWWQAKGGLKVPDAKLFMHRVERLS